MPLPTNYSRPAIPYNPVQILPNYDRYSSLGQFPPTPQQLDGDFNRVIDLVNTLAGAINDTAAGIFPGADILLNANRLPTTDGHGNVSWTLINPLNLDVNAVQTQHLQDTAITTPKIQVQAVRTNQLADGAVSYNKMADGAIGNAKMANNSTMLVKLRSSGHSCFVMGDDADYAYKELPVAPNYTIPTRIANETKPSMQSISVVWNKSADNLCSGVKLADKTTPLSKLQSGGITSIIIGGSDGVVKILPAASAFGVPSVRAGKVYPSWETLYDVWNNSTPNVFSGTRLQDDSVYGSKLVDGTVPVKKIQYKGQVSPFCMGYIAENGSAQKSMNLGSITRTGTGYYLVRFNTQANDAKYIVVLTNEDNGGQYLTNAYVAAGSRTVNGFDVQIWTQARAAQDEGFNFVVYAF
jgi:hypothetical protein